MADFDDLIPKTRSNPILDNPFEDPFADVVRPRSPDPWASAASYYQQPSYGTDPYQSGNPTSEDTYSAAEILANQQPFASIPDSTAPRETLLEEDPLNAESNAASDEDPPRRNPLGPLPVVRAETPPPQPKEALPADINADEVPDPKDSQKEEIPNSTVPASDAVLNEASTPKLPLSPVSQGSPTPTVTNPATPVIGDTSVEALVRDVSPPPTKPSPVPRYPSTAPSPAPSTDSVIQATPPSPAPISASNSISSRAQSDTIPHYERIVSPLQTPSHSSTRMPLERSFSGLALGGEVPGWGAPPSSSSSSTSISSPVYTRNPHDIDDDDDDDKPLAATMNLDTQSVATLKEGILQSSKTEGGSKDTTSVPPLFTITVGDPQKVGDPISAHIVYTVSTRTSAPDFKKSSFSVLRRYSDFLWLYETLINNNPGVVVPPVPEKVSFGRFEGTFVESRRLALNKCIQKIADHPRLCRDPDFSLFLESDSFTLDIKHRKAEQGGGLMASIGSSITGPKFYETDEWFDKKKTYLDTLESQLRGLTKSIDSVAKARAEVITSTLEFSEAIKALGSSDLSKQLSNSLNVLADVERKIRDLLEEQSKDDVVTILGTVEEYIRLITSVRLTFTSRIKAYHTMKVAEVERNRVKTNNEKILRQRGLDRQSIMPLHKEMEHVETKAQEARTEYEEVTKLIKVEVARFEQERVNDFKTSLEAFLEGMIRRQDEIVADLEQYQQLLLKRVGMNPPGPQSLISVNEAFV